MPDDPILGFKCPDCGKEGVHHCEGWSKPAKKPVIITESTPRSPRGTVFFEAASAADETWRLWRRQPK